MLPELARRSLAELLGTAGLLAAVVGSGIAAQRLSPGDAGIQLLENSSATALALVALILAFSSVSGAHFNPLVTLTELARGRMRLGEAAAYVLAQVVGAVAGVALANAMFALEPLHAATHVRSGWPLWIGEGTATLGLLLTIRGTAVSAPRAVPFAVAAYIGAAYWFTSSTSFANPAVTLARAFTDTFAGITLGSVGAFVLAQGVGAAIAFALAAVLWAGRDREPTVERRP